MTISNTNLSPAQALAGANNQTSASSGISSLTADDFVKLFLAQMTHQDPTHPTDSSAILQQMSQISQLSASSAMQKTMNNLATSVQATMGSSQVLEATQLIGRQVEIPSGIIPLTKDPASGTTSMAGSVMVPSAASDVAVTIKDNSGNILRTIHLGAAAGSGLLDFQWDGKDMNNNPVPADYYHVSATATVNGQAVKANTAGAFTVNSVGLDQTSGVILNVDGLGGQPMGNIIKIL